MTLLLCGIKNMTQMSQSMEQKQNQGHREQTYGCQGGGRWERDGVESGISRCKLGYRWTQMDKPQGPTVQHRELYSISCDKPSWKDYEKEYIDA